MAARELRYNWFKELLHQLHFDYILTAHHADDNLETFLINFTRGTGINGLTGIPPLNDNIVRPLLLFSRENIENYAKENSIAWREDSSNSSRKYLRNKLRHEVLPVLKEINPQLLDSFQNTLENLKGSTTIIEDRLEVFKMQTEVISNHAIASYKISEFKKLNSPKAYLFELFKDYGFTEWNDVLNLLDAQSGKFVQSQSHRLIKHRDILLLAELKTDTYSAITINEGELHVKAPFGELQFETIDDFSKNTDSEIYIDKSILQYPLTLRVWEDGDVFQPSGMAGKKKVSKYLKDEKVSLLEKENTWLLLSGNDVIWVVGKREDERFIVDKNAKKISRIKLKR